MNQAAEIIIRALQLPRVGPKTARKIAEALISKNFFYSDEAFTDNVSSLPPEFRIPQLSKADFEFATKKADVIIHESLKGGIKFTTLFDADYPSNLRKLKKPPLLLNYIGDITVFNNHISGAVIGTREPTEHGYKAGVKISEIFADQKFIVVSGLAKGCDTAGHTGCLNRKGITAAVLAHGILNPVYPKENRELAKKILDTGGLLISEYFLHQKPMQNFFIERDRIQAGLSDFVFVIETGIKGGTMHTVNFACESGITLYAYNHPKAYLNEDKVQGNQQLIKDKKAIPIGNPEDITSLITHISSINPWANHYNSQFQTPSVFLPPIHIKLSDELEKKKKDESGESENDETKPQLGLWE
jgi:DNA processing protein